MSLSSFRLHSQCIETALFSVIIRKPKPLKVFFILFHHRMFLLNVSLRRPFKINTSMQSKTCLQNSSFFYMHVSYINICLLILPIEFYLLFYFHVCAHFFSSKFFLIIFNISQNSQRLIHNVCEWHYSFSTKR